MPLDDMKSYKNACSIGFYVLKVAGALWKECRMDNSSIYLLDEGMYSCALFAATNNQRCGAKGPVFTDDAVEVGDGGEDDLTVDTFVH